MEREDEEFGFSTEPMIVEFSYPQSATRLSMEELLRRLETQEGTVDGKPGQQKQQKTFFQQNWMFFVVGAVLVKPPFGLCGLTSNASLSAFSNPGKPRQSRSPSTEPRRRTSSGKTLTFCSRGDVRTKCAYFTLTRPRFQDSV